jgi:hypothetical protein
MTWTQCLAGWALAYISVSVLFGLITMTEADSFWGGVVLGVATVSFVLICTTLALLSNGWLPV